MNITFDQMQKDAQAKQKQVQKREAESRLQSKKQANDVEFSMFEDAATPAKNGQITLF